LQLETDSLLYVVVRPNALGAKALDAMRGGVIRASARLSRHANASAMVYAAIFLSAHRAPLVFSF